MATPMGRVGITEAFISNVPAAFFLAAFTADWRDLARWAGCDGDWSSSAVVELNNVLSCLP